MQFIRLSGNAPARSQGIDRHSLARSTPPPKPRKEDVRLFVLFLDDYHVDKAPQVMIPLRRTLKAFVDKLGPYDLDRGHGSADAAHAISSSRAIAIA